MTALRSQIKTEFRRLARMVAIAAAGLALLALASLFSAQPTATFFRLLSLAGTALLLFSVAMMVVTFRMANEVKPGALVVSLGVTLAALAVQLLLRGATASLVPATLAFVGGGLIGAGWSKTRLFFIDGATIRCRGTAWYLAVWGGIFALNQFMAASAAGAPAAMTGALLVGSGIVAGSTIEQLVRYWRVSGRLGERQNIPVGEPR